jgi:adenylate cyclase
MEISKYRQTQIIETLSFSLTSAAIGVVFAVLLKYFVFVNDTGTSLARFSVLGALTGGIICLTFMIIGPWLERLFSWPLLIVLILTPITYAGIIGVEYGAIYVAVMGRESLLTNSLIGETIAFSLLISFVLSFIGMISRLLGHNVLSGFLIGKYRRPVRENRFVMYLDLAGSTAIAERIGNIAFMSFLNDFFCDISRPIIDCQGDIHKYVGDEAIVTWTKKDGESKASAIESFFAIGEKIRARASYYEAKYAVVPRFRAGLHYGEVIVGEMGDVKREIAILGDVMNTASRIQGECRTLGEDFLVSGEALSLLEPFMAGYSVSSRGNAELRGKETKISLHAIRSA